MTTSAINHIDAGKDTLETGRVIGIGSYFTVDLDEALSEDSCNFTLIQGVLETVSNHE